MRKHYFICRVVCYINNIIIHLPAFQEQLGMMFIATLKFFRLETNIIHTSSPNTHFQKCYAGLLKNIVILTTYLTLNLLKVNHPP